MNFRAIYKKGLDSVRLSGGKSAWGLEIGDSGLKAVKASARDGELFIEAIDRIDYSSIEHEVTSKKPDLIEDAVNIFKERNLISKSDKIIDDLDYRIYNTKNLISVIFNKIFFLCGGVAQLVSAAES